MNGRAWGKLLNRRRFWYVLGSLWLFSKKWIRLLRWVWSRVLSRSIGSWWEPGVTSLETTTKGDATMKSLAGTQHMSALWSSQAVIYKERLIEKKIYPFVNPSIWWGSADHCDLIPWSHTSLSLNRAFAVVGPALWNDTPPALQSVMLQGISSASLRSLETFIFISLSRWIAFCEGRFTNSHIT